MPIAFSPESTTDICLEADKARPEDQRVYFRCRFLTRRQALRVRDLVRQCLQSDDQYPLVLEALKVGVVGPVNAKDPETGEPLPCAIESLDALLSLTEQFNLACEYPGAVGLSELEKKVSGSASATPSALKESAGSAEPKASA